MVRVSVIIDVVYVLSLYILDRSMFTLSFLMTGYSFQDTYHTVLRDVRALIRDKTLVLAPFLLNEMIEIR